jgi:transposase
MTRWAASSIRRSSPRLCAIWDYNRSPPTPTLTAIKETVQKPLSRKTGERGFRFLKDPLFMASTVFLKSAQRIMALAIIMTLSLIVYSALEHRIRQSLKAHQQTVSNQKGHPTDHPTARWVFQFFTGIHLLVIESIREVILNLKDTHQTLLALLGAHFVALYANSE